MVKGALLESSLSTTTTMTMRGGKKLGRRSVPLLLGPWLVSAGLLALLFFVTIMKLNASNGLWIEGERRPRDRNGYGGGTRFSSSSSVMPHDVALALLHFATTKEVPQQSKEEIGVTLSVLLKRAPCNFLVFGMWHDSLLWATFNHGGRTVFLDESQDWIDRMRVKHPELETYKVDYCTTLKDASRLLSNARATRLSECRPNQRIESSDCPLAMSQLPRTLLSMQWDVIMIDGPRSFPKFPAFPGRMSPIYTSAVMARGRSAKGYTDIFLHDVSRPLERQYGQEFLCESNLMKSVGDLWHFQIQPSNNSTQFCSENNAALVDVV